MQAAIPGADNTVTHQRGMPVGMIFLVVLGVAVNINNVKIQQFPELLVARLFAFKAFELLQFAAEELKDVDIGQRFIKS
jgi:hypothetical protein